MGIWVYEERPEGGAGVILFVVGLMIVFFTRFKVEAIKNDYVLPRLHCLRCLTRPRVPNRSRERVEGSGI